MPTHDCPLGATVQDHTADIATHTAEIDHLKEGQKTQTAYLQRIDDKFDGLKNIMIGSLVSAICALIAAGGSLFAALSKH